MKAIVDSLLIGVVYPIIAAIFGKPDFRQIGFDIGDARISIGLVIDAIMSFIVVGLILFLLVKGWNRLRRTPGEAEGDTELSVLREIREELRPAARAEPWYCGAPPGRVPGGAVARPIGTIRSW